MPRYRRAKRRVLAFGQEIIDAWRASSEQERAGAEIGVHAQDGSMLSVSKVPVAHLAVQP